MIENAKDLITKEKIGEFEPQRQKDQLSTALETKEHQDCKRAVSSITSSKEGFMEHIHMYKKHGRHDIDVESANNEEQFATQFFNFMRKHPNIIISQVSSTNQFGYRHCFALCSANSEQCRQHSQSPKVPCG
jgi:hypothetical protein